MSIEEVESAVGVEVEAEAPAVEVDSASVSDDAPVAEVASDESTDTADSSLAAEAEDEDATTEDVASVSFPSADEFGWDDWDGTREALPEMLHPWAERFNTYYQSKIDTAVEDLGETRKIYEAIMGGEEDPRITKLTTASEEWGNKFADLEGQHEALRREYEDYQKVVDQAIEEEAQMYVDSFKKTNNDLFEDEVLSDTFANLLDNGWTLEQAAVAARLPKNVLAVAERAKADGVPEAYALRLAEGAKSQPAKPRKGAEITSGATTPARTPEQASLDTSSAMSLKDFRSHVARNALKKHRS